MRLIVQKFGGSSVANNERIFNVAGIVTDTYKTGNNVVVVVSAQGDTTDELIEKARSINPNASKREMDALLSSGEQISATLLAMAIESMGYPVISLNGRQAGFTTDSNHSKARIKIAAGTQAGKVLRLKGKGLPEVNGYGRGDILVVVDVIIPAKINSEEKKLLEKLAAQPNFKKTDTVRGEQNIFERMRNFFG